MLDYLAEVAAVFWRALPYGLVALVLALALDAYVYWRRGWLGKPKDD